MFVLTGPICLAMFIVDLSLSDIIRSILTNWLLFDQVAYSMLGERTTQVQPERTG